MLLNRLSLNKQLLALVIAAVVPLSVAGLTATYLLSKAYDETASARLQHFATSVLDSIELRVEGTRAAAQVLALSEELQRDDFQAFRRKAELFVAQHHPDSAVVVTGRDGQQRVNTGLPEHSPLPNNGPGGPTGSYTAVFERGVPVVSPGFQAPAAKRYVATVNVPVFQGGVAVYNLALPMTSEYLSQALAQAAQGPDTLIALFDQNLKLLARSRDGKTFLGRDPSPTLLPLLLSNHKNDIVVTTTFDGTRVLTAAATSASLNWKLAVGVPESTVKAPFERAVLLIAAFGLASLFLGAMAALRLATHVVRENKHRDMLLDELNHRVKNTLFIVQSIVSQTLRRKRGDEAKRDIEGRLIALSHAHDVLTSQRWEGGSLSRVVDSALKAYVDLPARITIRVADRTLLPKQSIALSMLMHELATNAAKYGALCESGGVLEVTGTFDNINYQIEWREQVHQRVSQPDREGFGTLLIQRIVETDLDGRVSMTFTETGLLCVLTFPLVPLPT